MTTSMGEWTTDGPQMGERWWRDTAIALRAALAAAEERAEQAERELATTIDPLPFAADAAHEQDRAEAAEARVAALTEVLRGWIEVLDNPTWNCDPSNACYYECSDAWREAGDDAVAKMRAALASSPEPEEASDA